MEGEGEEQTMAGRAEAVAEERKKKISEGMKKSHARRKKQKKLRTVEPPRKSESTALRQLIKERDGLNVAIAILQRRGL